MTFEIPGKCQPKQRPRRGKGGHFYTPKETRNYEALVKMLAHLAMRGREPFKRVKLDIVIHHQMPNSWSTAKKMRALAGELIPGRSDLDNCVKVCGDGMNGIAYVDDRQVVRLSASKVYGCEHKVIVTLSDV